MVVLFLLMVVIAQQSNSMTRLAVPAPTAAATSQAAAPTTSSAAAEPSAPATPLAQKVARNLKDDPMAWGDPDAPLLVVEWTDFRCPFCAAFANGTLPVLYEDYVKSGKMRFEIHDVAFFGDHSVDAAVAARAAGAQGKYREFMTTLYAAAPPSGHPDMPKDKLVGFAKTAGVPDLAKFTTALEDKALRTQVTESTTLAQSMGVSGVPFFVIGNQTMDGAQPLASFQQVIEKELAAAK
ncbi:protein-disulfide isomerase [Propionicimonas paludicola]|uniref:Protein-disulfide isomerase n=1 Tax=Propionicimonas paludicola TaxID=185243 RepID=A0A2A9CNE8_9ACTN|nr:protein-disulfide isomerase [Propionicimonas paludicola]